MELPGCLWFCHLSGEEQVGLADIVKYLGLCTWYSLSDWKMGHMPFWFAYTLPSARQDQSPKPKDRAGAMCMYWTGVKGQTRPHTLLCSSISFTHPSNHCSKIHTLMPLLCYDPCPALEMQRELLTWNTRKPEQRQARGWGGRNLGFWVRLTWVLFLASATCQEVKATSGPLPNL